ncbi:uncharacterized protein CTRU02_214579 [Colletotrichum truncatum]|uniref:Uncharacterized protein n=1 Tax=Colletotrichum truncatum TaxID=5467 RepID=A0ACC3YF49_COLTU|nr:uncharacterized protein CTRU02_09526 [Colletotrichum truncatum]KAF6788208.1 hypothetical protein CTRU02_09526 [Colletotrichum truncatum]
MKTCMLLASAAALALCRRQSLKSQVPTFDLCAASPLFPDYQLACGKLPIWSSQAPNLDEAATNRTTEQPKKDIWRSDEGWIGPHTCAGAYCAYSRPSFANGRGIVLVSTAYNAEEASHISAFTTSANDVKDKGDSALFRVVEMPGKGLGLIAAKKIKRGQSIMTLPPAIVIHRRFIDDVDLENQYRLLDIAVNNLPKATREVFLSQMGQSGGHKVHDIIHTNSFEMRLAIKDGHHFGNYPEVSRFNHDCRPNVAFYIDSDLRHHTQAVRNIEPGEELTISYVDSLSSRQVRQDRAKRNWGFGCTCKQCSLPPALVKDSDDRLWKMWQMEQELSDWNSITFDEDTIEALIKLYREENLDKSHGYGAYRLAALNYNSIQNEKKALEYTKKAVEQLVLEQGPKAKDLADILALLQEPKAHWSWGKRM